MRHEHRVQLCHWNFNIIVKWKDSNHLQGIGGTLNHANTTTRELTKAENSLVRFKRFSRQKSPCNGVENAVAHYIYKDKLKIIKSCHSTELWKQQLLFFRIISLSLFLFYILCRDAERKFPCCLTLFDYCRCGFRVPRSILKLALPLIDVRTKLN